MKAWMSGDQVRLDHSGFASMVGATEGMSETSENIIRVTGYDLIKG